MNFTQKNTFKFIMLSFLFFSNSFTGRYKDCNIETKEIDGKLFEAVDEKNKNKIKQLINEGANINAYLYHQNAEQTPLHRALHNKSLEIAELLLDLGADINATDEFGETALQYCDTKECLNFAEKLILLGADVNVQRQGGLTPLHMLVGEKDTIDIIRLLIKNNANIYSKDMLGLTPIAYSINNEEILKYFLSLNVDINIPLLLNVSMLHLSIWNNNEETTNLLIKNNVNVNQKALFGITPLFLVITKIIDSKFIGNSIIYTTDFDFNHYLYEDYYEDRYERLYESINNSKITQLNILEFLLKRGADLHEKMQSINDFFNQNPKLKENIETTFEGKKISEKDVQILLCNIKNPYYKNELEFNLLHSLMIQYLLIEQILKHEKDDLEVKRKKILNKYEQLNLVLYFLLRDYKDLDLPGYSPYELIKKHYSTLVNIVEKEDKNKELIHLRKLLEEIK